jgi:hypothetical protein
VILESLELDPIAFEARTGWAIKPEGACSGDVCVPLPAADLDARTVAERLGMPLVHDEVHGLWALGPASVTGRALTTAVAPDLILPTEGGAPFSLSSTRGSKVVLVAWASW